MTFEYVEILLGSIVIDKEISIQPKTFQSHVTISYDLPHSKTPPDF